MRKFAQTLGSGVLMMASLSAQAEVKTITDVIGREVKVELPAKRVVLGFYFEDYLAWEPRKPLILWWGFPARHGKVGFRLTGRCIRSTGLP